MLVNFGLLNPHAISAAFGGCILLGIRSLALSASLLEMPYKDRDPPEKGWTRIGAGSRAQNCPKHQPR